jgi:hypothetical protein
MAASAARRADSTATVVMATAVMAMADMAAASFTDATHCLP